MEMANFLYYTGLFFLGFSGILGLVAIASPQQFASLAQRSTNWVDTSKFLNFLDKQIDVDGWVLKHSRVFGCLVLCAVAVLSYAFVA